VSDILDTLRALVRDELSRLRGPELGTVSHVYPKTDDDGPDNHQVNVKLLASGVELQRIPVIVPRIGLSALPREGDLMVLVFVGGALNAPVALGCLYSADAHPPKAAEDEVVYQPPDAAQSGVRRLHIEIPSGTTITLDDDKLEIVAGDTKFTLERDGDVAIAAKGSIKLSADGDIEIDAAGDLTLSSQKTSKVSGLSVKVEGQSDAKVSGPQVSLAGITQFSPS